MLKPTISLVIVLVSVSCSGCGVFTNVLNDGDKPGSATRSGKPSERVAPRSLESLTGPPQRPDARSFGSPPIAIGEELPTRDQLADRISLEQPRDTVDVDGGDDLEQLILQQPAQLPSILEEDFSSDQPEGTLYTLSDQLPQDGPSPVANESVKHEVATPENVKQPVMRFQAKPTDDPPQALPNNLNEMFSTAKQAKPVSPENDTEAAGNIAQVNHEATVVDPKDKLAPVTVQDPEEKKSSDQSAEILTLEVPSEQDSSNEAIPGAPVQNEPKPLTLNDQLAQAIAALSELMNNPELDDSTHRQLKLQQQMLLLASGKFDESEFDVEAMDENEKEFWRHHLAAINEMMNAKLPEHPAARTASLSRTAESVLVRLKSATSELANVAPLVIDHMELCTQISGYGQFTPAHRQFQPGQQVLIYSEIDNYTLREQSQQTGVQYFAEMRGQYSILNSENRIVSQYQYQPVQDLARRRRNDFYMYFPVTMDRDLPPGKYRLVLTVEDLVGNKAASTTQPVEFEIISPRAVTASGTQRTIR